MAAYSAPLPNRLQVTFSGVDAGLGETMRSVLVPSLENCVSDVRGLPMGASIGFNVIVMPASSIRIERLRVPSAWSVTGLQVECIESALRSTPWPAAFRDGVVVLTIMPDLSR